jgi:hypothetical protein
MTVEEVPLETLLGTRERLIGDIHRRARDDAARRFLMSFHALEPDWAAIGFDSAVGELPAVRWKQLNLGRLRERNEAKFADQLEALSACLDS